MPGKQKPLEWVARAHDELADFPREARHAAGLNLRQVQKGEAPQDWKAMERVGQGAREIRIRTHEGGTVQHRVIYVAKFEEAVYVLHAFRKTTEATSQHNVEVARARYAQMLRERQDRNHPPRGGTR
jgi:phage-related protein